jgi:NADPH-dependent curcumin reductase CurA
MPSQVAFLKERGGYDDAFNYKTTSYEEGIKRLCPGGIDVL